MTTDAPRPEHPRPQLERPDWRTLNGEWSCELDLGASGWDRGLYESTGFGQRIVVPFAPESPLSGVAYRDFIPAMWYHRLVAVPEAWRGKRILLHFGAVDYASEVYVDGTLAGRHWGGTSSFSVDLTRLVRPGGEHRLVVSVRDDVRAGIQPSGKQSTLFHSRGCHYTRTTGIWQTVWMEAVHPLGLRRVTLLPDALSGALTLVPDFCSCASDASLKLTVSRDGAPIARVEAPALTGLPVTVRIPSPVLWEPGNPALYDLTLEVVRGSEVCDRVTSYAGIRSIAIDGGRVTLNGKPLYQRLVLDQGFYPDGIWTAPSDAALRRDIELSQAAGFNGARLHQKVFEERFHYWADRMGYLTWGESSSWGCNVNTELAARAFLAEWAEIVTRDRNHPSIVAWSPFNETSGISHPPQHKRLHVDAYELTRAIDPTRPVNDASGYIHVRTDLWTVHTYEQDPAKLKEILARRADGGVFRNVPEHEAEYAGQPYLVDEFGGIKWDPGTQLQELDRERRGSWGYGQAPRSLEEFYARLEGMVEVLVGMKHVAGWCYTQLTDVEQEQNGVYFYDRSAKFDMARIRSIFTRP
jgi:beta-galactosidase/beta-glucuronidase